ncbi:hypothetical protein C0Q70_14579 [Pomacea canaliculata]|uniref:C-type lectin domain-containing protein n=1 Tax=Pomacea canaliculata TaxID=400727 RepID=A0A2T7NSE9_POMCA|nr:hypothetical protein C0Q70_14579 [Pomacea canaliculata]
MSLTATSHLLTTSQRLAMLTALLVAILCQQHVHTWSVTTSGQWERSGSHILPTTNQIRARSPVHCASFCLQNARCFRFCHHTVSLDCFVDDGMTPPSGQVSSVEGAVCYDKIKKNCWASAGFTMLGLRCAKLNSTLATYSSATQQCALEGGHLYHLKTLALDEPPLRSLVPLNPVPKYTWLGADAIGRHRQFTWTDGSPLPAVSEIWSAYEPFNYDGLEDCLSLVNYRGNDIRYKPRPWLPSFSATDQSTVVTHVRSVLDRVTSLQGEGRRDVQSIGPTGVDSPLDN